MQLAYTILLLFLSVFFLSERTTTFNTPNNRLLNEERRQGYGDAPAIAGRFLQGHVALQDYVKAGGAAGSIVQADLDSFYPPTFVARDGRFGFYHTGSLALTWVNEDRPDVLLGALYSHLNSRFPSFDIVAWHDAGTITYAVSGAQETLPAGPDIPDNVPVLVSKF